MSLRLDGVTDYAERTTAANLGSTVNCTALMWYRKEDSTNDREILTMGKSGQGGLWQVASGTQIKAHISSESGVAINMATNSWAGLAITYNSTSGNWIFYFYQSGTLTTVATQYGGSGSNTSSLRVGNNDAWGDSARGSNRYLRYWTRELSAAEVQAEFEMTPSSGTPAASATNLYLSWPLADSTDTTDWTGNSRAPTISGAATSSEEPTIGGGTAPTITDAGDEQYYAGETGIVIAGTNFGASQGSNGRVYLSPTDDVDDAGRVSQTITAWSATSITFTATLGSLSLDTNLYLFVLADSTESNAAGYVVQIVARPFIRDTLIGLNGAAVASETGMTMLVYHSVPATAVAPAQVITGVSTNGSGQLDQVINRGALALNAPVWLILMKDGSPAKATARKVTPVYE